MIARAAALTFQTRPQRFNIQNLYSGVHVLHSAQGNLHNILLVPITSLNSLETPLMATSQSLESMATWHAPRNLLAAWMARQNLSQIYNSTFIETCRNHCCEVWTQTNQTRNSTGNLSPDRIQTCKGRIIFLGASPEWVAPYIFLATPICNYRRALRLHSTVVFLPGANPESALCAGITAATVEPPLAPQTAVLAATANVH